MMLSMPIYIAMNSLKNVLDSTVFYLLLYQTIGARLRNTMKPVCDCLFTLFAACNAPKQKLPC